MQKINTFRIFGIFLVAVLLVACNDDDDMPDPTPNECEVATTSQLVNTAFQLNIPLGFQNMNIPDDNPLTVEGIALGRKLFYDPVLSVDSTIACASCHKILESFTDSDIVSKGVNGLLGRRNSMSLLNVGYVNKGLFWDGRSATLEEQALVPVEDPNEMAEDWENVERKIRCSNSYPEEFAKVFGINNSREITRTHITKAIAQFERSIISLGNSKFDKVSRGEDFFSDDEQAGFDIFMDADPLLPDAECGHCHTPPLFTTHQFFNNGLDEIENLENFTDKGLGDFSGRLFDNGKFKVPTLRNIKFTAPYMHDGRFKTIDQVLDHYISGGHRSPNVDPLITSLSNPTDELHFLSDVHILQLKTFLETLNEPDVLNYAPYSRPN